MYLSTFRIIKKNVARHNITILFISRIIHLPRSNTLRNFFLYAYITDSRFQDIRKEL